MKKYMLLLTFTDIKWNFAAERLSNLLCMQYTVVILQSKGIPDLSTVLSKNFKLVL